MSLPELLHRQALKQLEHFCDLEANHQLNPRQIAYHIEGRLISLFEVRSSCQNPQNPQQIPIARLRYSPQLNQWSLHHQNGEHWQLYLNANPTLDLKKLLTAIQMDPYGHFWPE